MTLKNGLSKRSLLNLIGIKVLHSPRTPNTKPTSDRVSVALWRLVFEGISPEGKKNKENVVLIFSQRKNNFRHDFAKGVLREPSKLFKFLDKRMNGRKMGLYFK